MANFLCSWCAFKKKKNLIKDDSKIQSIGANAVLSELDVRISAGRNERSALDLPSSHPFDTQPAVIEWGITKRRHTPAHGGCRTPGGACRHAASFSLTFSPASSLSPSSSARTCSCAGRLKKPDQPSVCGWWVTAAEGNHDAMARPENGGKESQNVVLHGGKNLKEMN